MAQDDTSKSTPYVLAMVLCDGIHRDPGSGKVSLLGLCSAILAREFPAVHQKIIAYVELTDGRGPTVLKIKLVDAEEERDPLFTAEAEVEFGDPRSVVATSVVLANVPFPQPGEYRFQLIANDELLMERRLVAMKVDG